MKWGDERNLLITHNMYHHLCNHASWVVPTLPLGSPVPDYFAPLLDKKAMLDCLTLADARELSAFELPAFPNPFQADGRIQKDLDIRPGTLPADLFTASLCVQFLGSLCASLFQRFRSRGDPVRHLPCKRNYIRGIQSVAGHVTLDAFGPVCTAHGVDSNVHRVPASVVVVGERTDTRSGSLCLSSASRKVIFQFSISTHLVKRAVRFLRRLPEEFQKMPIDKNNQRYSAAGPNS